MTAIKADKLCFTYPYEKKPAINGLTFSLEKGESLAVMGSNGSGKSTLIRLLSGLLVPTSGSVVTDGIVLSDKKSRKEVKRHIQSVFQEPSGQFVTATPREEARFVAGLFDRSEDDISRIFCEYARFMDREFTALSGGEKQKMALALAMLTGASVLVFDEALSSLDPKERKDFLEIILSLKAEGRTVIYITQEADEALLFDKLLILDDGAFAPPRELLYSGRYPFLPFRLRLEKRKKELRHHHPVTSDRVILECNALSLERASAVILSDVTFSLHEGEVLGLTGDNGSGKTTLLDCISGFEKRYSGKVQFSSLIGYAVQEPEKLFFCTSVEKELLYGGRTCDVREILALTGLDEALLSSSPFTLSGGEKRRLAVSLFLAKDVKILLLDEPSSALDPEGREKLEKLIRSLKEKGVSIIIADHNLELLSEVCDSVLRLEGGRGIIHTVSEFFTPAVFERYSLPLTDAMKHGFSNLSEMAEALS